jgi:signal transduction histidine kinase
MKLSIKLPLMIAIAALIVVVPVVSAVIAVVRSNITRAENDANLNSASVYAGTVDFYLGEARSIIETSASQIESVGFSPGQDGTDESGHIAVHDVADSILGHSRLFAYLMLLDAKGYVALIEPHELLDTLIRSDMAYSEWYKKVTTSGETTVSDLGISLATKLPTVIVATPLLDSAGNLVGIWAGAIKLEELSLAGLSVGAQSRYGYITDSRGLIVAHQQNQQYVVNQTDFSAVPPVAAALSGKTGTMRYISPIDGIEKLAAYIPLPDLGWAVNMVIPTSVAFSSLASLSLLLIALGVLMVMLLITGAIIISRQITIPLGKLNLATQKMSAGDLDHRVIVHGKDELGQLGTAFNQMASSISVKERDIGRSNTELTAANKELETFSYSVSHDLRAPLRSIDGFSQILLEDYGDKLDDTGKDYLKRVRAASQRMAELIDDLLKLSKVTRYEINREEIDLVVLAKNTLLELRKTQPERQVEFITDGSIIVNGDRRLLGILMENLIGNAWKFTGRHPHARIEIGAGFDMTYIDKLFAPFQRLHAATEFPGIGIGLATSQRIVHRHGGIIWAEGKVEGGATIYFTL